MRSLGEVADVVLEPRRRVEGEQANRTVAVVAEGVHDNLFGVGRSIVPAPAVVDLAA
jgi:hypothetical protein